MRRFRLLSLTLGLLLSCTSPALSELLALLNYESKPCLLYTSPNAGVR